MFDINNINPTGMYFKIMLVTPEMAKEWLKTNDRNRTPNKDKLAKLKYDLENGYFELTHQAIAFDVDGKLSDGQHRLTEIAETGIAAPLSVAFNAPRSANMDIGTKRSPKQSLYMAGIIEKGTLEYDCLTYPLISFMVYRSLGEERMRSLTPMNRHILYMKYKSLIDPIIEIGTKANGKCRSSAIMYSMMCALNGGVPESTIGKWHKIVETGDFYDEDKQILMAGRSVLLFKKIANENTTISTTRSKKEEVETIIKKAMSSISHYAKLDNIAKLYGELVYEDIQVSEKDMQREAV